MKNIIYRWVYMFSALVAAVAMNYFTVLSFQPDRGIIYIRSYEMTQTVFRVTQTKLDNSEESEVVAVISLKWLNRAKWAIIAMTILCTDYGIPSYLGSVCIVLCNTDILCHPDIR